MYRARDKNLDIDVALKVLKPSFAYDEVFEKNFRREAHRAAKFRHPNVIAIHYAGKEDDIVFFSMDLLETGLEDIVEEGPADENTLLKVGSDVASALEFAHSHEGGLVHRDLKPDNILFDRHGNAVVTDFGIAEAATNYTQATGTTVYIGTPTYMSPEQARGRQVDSRSDIYSLGATLYEVATGEAPFKGNDWFELGRKHIEEDPTPPRERGAQISADLEQVILKCLEKKPEDRYQDASRIESDLKSIAGGGEPATVVLPSGAPEEQETQKRPPPEEAREPTGAEAEAEEAAEEAGGRSGVAAVVAAVVLLLVAFGGAYRFNVAGLQQRVPALATVPLIGPGEVQPIGVSPTFVAGSDRAAVDGPVQVQFSGFVLPDSATSRRILLLSDADDTVDVEVSVPAGSDGREIQITPRDSLAFGTRYRVEVQPGLVSTAGLQVAPPDEPLTFRTQEDVFPPEVASGPGRGQEGVPPSGPLEVTFSEPLDPATVMGGDNIRLLSSAGESVSVDIYPSGTPDTARTYSVWPSGGGLSEGASYRLVLGRAPADSSIRDRAGNALAPDTLAFTTGAEGTGQARRPPSGEEEEETPEYSYLELDVDNARHTRILVDGRDRGAPPVNLRIPPGSSHEVRVIGITQGLAQKRFTLADTSFTVPPGATGGGTLQVPRFGSVVFGGNSGRTVLVDGREIGETPVAGHPLTAGQHTLEIRPAEGEAGSRSAYTGTFTVQAYTWDQPVQYELPRP